MKAPLFSQRQIYEFIKQHEPFKEMSDECLFQLAGVLEIESCHGDSLLIKKGEKLNDLYILIRGRLYFQVTDATGKVTYHGELNEGSIIGEIALLSDLERSADVYALRDSIILKLTQKKFLTLSKLYPELMNKITQFTIKRLTHSLQGITPPPSRNKSIALIPIRPIASFESQLREIINKFPYGEKILLLTNNSFQEKQRNHLLDHEGKMSRDGILWMNQHEAEYSFIFYLADSTMTNWTKFCVRQADSMAFLAAAEDHDYSLSVVEQELQENKQHCVKRNILMLLHETPANPHNTRFWLEKRSVNNHYHVQTNTDIGMSRMMRIFTDNTVSLVLSGGGARGIAHIGVYRLLEERNIPIDYIAGNSMGAMLAAAFAMGYGSDEVLRMLKEYLIKGARIDFTFPYIAIATGKRIADGLRTIFGQNNHIEDLWINYFCVSTDLVSQNLYVHDKGSLWESIRSSISLPFIYPPVSYGDKLLLDGGVLNNIPIDVMRHYSHSSKILASNISSNTEFKLNPLPHSLSGWKLLYNRFIKNEAALPINLGELVLRLLTISSQQNTEKMIAMADHYISLNLAQYGMLDFKKHKQIAQIGYQQAKEQLRAQNVNELLGISMPAATSLPSSPQLDQK